MSKPATKTVGSPDPSGPTQPPAARSPRPGPDSAPEAERPVVEVVHLGRMDYAAALAEQKSRVGALKLGQGRNCLLLVEHPPVLTLGRRGDTGNILAAPAQLEAMGIRVHHIERGGDVTYHGPGQLVAYPILDLRAFRKDVRWYSGALAETAVRTLAAFGIAAQSREGLETGVWLADGSGKIAALGVRIERWISYHGIALNVSPELEHFGLIVPCGLAGVRTRTMAELLGGPIRVEEVLPVFVRAFGEVFGAELRDPSAEAPDTNVAQASSA